MHSVLLDTSFCIRLGKPSDPFHRNTIDYFDGKTAGEFHSMLLNKKSQFENIERNIVKDDCKLIAQIFNRKLDAISLKTVNPSTR